MAYMANSYDSFHLVKGYEAGPELRPSLGR